MSSPTKQIPALNEFIQRLALIPFVSSRNSYRLAEHFLGMHGESMKEFFQAIIRLRDELSLCERCCGWKELATECFWCGSMREQRRICVVETWIDASAIDRSGAYQGTYHTLGGAIAPLDGIMPEQLSYELLLERIEALHPQEVELIIATNQTPEGEATASYCLRLLQRINHDNISVSQLSAGVPVGSALEFIDKLTLSKALVYRRQLQI